MHVGLSSKVRSLVSSSTLFSNSSSPARQLQVLALPRAILSYLFAPSQLHNVAVNYDAATSNAMTRP